MKKKKMTKLEKKEATRIKQAKKKLQPIRKKLATTLDWIDIRDVTENSILLKNGEKKFILKGIKIEPHNIFIDDPITQNIRKERLRLCLNKVPDNLYHGFVHTPVNVDGHIADLLNAERTEEDTIVLKMIHDDFNKVEQFKDSFRELEFFVMLRDSDEKELEKRLYDLFTEFSNAGFNPSYLNKRDFYNYIDFVFENELINDYYFSRGIFSPLNLDMEFNEETNSYQVNDKTEEFESYGDIIPNIKQSYLNDKYSKKVLLSKLAPTSFSLQKDKYILGEKYVTNLLVTALPKEFYLGLLCDHINNPNIKLFMTTARLDMNIAALLKKDYNDKKNTYLKTKDPSIRSTLEAELSSLQQYVDESIRNNDTTHNLTLVFSIYADTEKELTSMRKDLRQSLSSLGFKTTTVKLMQEMLLRSVCPLFFETKLPKTIRENLGVPMPSDGVAGLYPYVFETLKDNKGFLLGWEQQNGGVMIYNPYYYLDSRLKSQQNQRVNGNTIIVGLSGSGKTTTMSLNIRHLIKTKTKIVWWDPENKNAPLTRRYGGTFVNWGQRGNIINIFDLKPITTDDDEIDFDVMWDTELAIFKVIEDVCQILEFLYPKISDDTLSIVGGMIEKAYNKVGISKAADGKYKPFKDLGYEDMPTFTTLGEVVNERIIEIGENIAYTSELALLNDLKIKLTRILGEWSVYFVGHTTIKFTNPERKIISFGTKILFNAPQNLRNALYHIMFNFGWNLCLNKDERSAFVIDEAHTVILEGSTAKLIAQFFRRSRKYWNIMLLGTQEPRDFADDRVLTDGKAIFNNSVYKIIMALNKDAADDISKLVTVNDNEKLLIQQFNQGEGLFICGNRRIPIKVYATPVELEEMGA